MLELVLVLERYLLKQPHFLILFFILIRNLSSDHILCEIKVCEVATRRALKVIGISPMVLPGLLNFFWCPNQNFFKDILHAKSDPQTVLY